MKQDVQDAMFIYYNKGFSDRKIAKELKISPRRVAKWRNEHGLPNNTLQKQMPRPSKALSALIVSMPMAMTVLPYQLKNGHGLSRM